MNAAIAVPDQGAGRSDAPFHNGCNEFAIEESIVTGTGWGRDATRASFTMFRRLGLLVVSALDVRVYSARLSATCSRKFNCQSGFHGGAGLPASER